MKKRIINSLLAATLTGSMMAGMVVPCFAEDKGNGGSITVLVESGSPAEALANNTAADFEKETGCKVVIDAVAYTGMYDKLSTEIKAGQAAHDVACIYVCLVSNIYISVFIIYKSFCTGLACKIKE